MTLRKRVMASKGKKEYPVGVWAYYADGSIRDYDSADTDAIGVALITLNVSIVIDKQESTALAFGGMNKDLTGAATFTSSPFTDFNGENNTTGIIAACAGYTASGITGAPAAEYCRTRLNGKGYLPSKGEMYEIGSNVTAVRNMMIKIGGGQYPNVNRSYWTSTLGGNVSTQAWRHSGYYTKATDYTMDRTNTYYARAIFKINAEIISENEEPLEIEFFVSNNSIVTNAASSTQQITVTSKVNKTNANWTIYNQSYVTASKSGNTLTVSIPANTDTTASKTGYVVIKQDDTNETITINITQDADVVYGPYYSYYLPMIAAGDFTDISKNVSSIYGGIASGMVHVYSYIENPARIISSNVNICTIGLSSVTWGKRIPYTTSVSSGQTYGEAEFGSFTLDSQGDTLSLRLNGSLYDVNNPYSTISIGETVDVSIPIVISIDGTQNLSNLNATYKCTYSRTAPGINGFLVSNSRIEFTGVINRTITAELYDNW